MILLAAIAQKWRFRLAPGEKAEPLPLVTLRVNNGLRMIPEPRSKAEALEPRQFAVIPKR